MLSPDMCSQLETTAVGDQLEAVRGEHNHAPKSIGNWSRGFGKSKREVSTWRTTLMLMKSLKKIWKVDIVVVDIQGVDILRLARNNDRCVSRFPQW